MKRYLEYSQLIEHDSLVRDIQTALLRWRDDVFAAGQVDEKGEQTGLEAAVQVSEQEAI